MKLNELANNWLRAGSAFGISSYYENNDAIKFSNTYLDGYKETGIELHYELHYREGNDDNHIRIDCHSFPYAEFKNAADYVKQLKKYYSEEKAEKIFSFRKAIKQIYLDYGKLPHSKELYYGKNNNDDSLFLVKMSLPATYSEAELIEKVAYFISLTYKQLVETLNELK